MQADEAQALGKLAGDAIAGTTSLAEELHQAIFDRSSGSAGPQTKAIHGAVATAVYGGLRGLSRGVGRLAGAGLARAQAGEGDRLGDSPAGGLALGVLGGIHGDHLEQDASKLAIEMSLRRSGRDVALDAGSLSAAFPDASSRLAVFIHGLSCTEETWWRFGEKSSHYGLRLQRELAFTPLYVRYNTGLRISDNGQRLAALIAQIVRSWPVAVDELVLIGHSMGGLVVRSACHYGEQAGQGWVSDVRHVFCLSSPHLGAPLEKAANVAGWVLGRFPETKPLARVINGRSQGIKDLRFGYLVDEDWQDQDPDALLENNRHHIPFLQTANYYYVGATLSSNPRHPVGYLVGDLLVRFPSSSGQGAAGQRIPFSIDNGHHAPGLNHFNVLNDPDVYRQIYNWLQRDSVAQPVRPF
ncbi:MAG: esterase/lipase family protein [Solirubrobacteraceae bacterium]